MPPDWVKKKQNQKKAADATKLKSFPHGKSSQEFNIGKVPLKNL